MGSSSSKDTSSSSSNKIVNYKPESKDAYCFKQNINIVKKESLIINEKKNYFKIINYPFIHYFFIK